MEVCLLLLAWWGKASAVNRKELEVEDFRYHLPLGELGSLQLRALAGRAEGNTEREGRKGVASRFPGCC